MNSTIDNLTKITNTINDIGEADPDFARMLWMGFRMSMDIARAKTIAAERNEPMDVSEQLDTVCGILGIDLQSLVMEALSRSNPQEDMKQVDEQTLEFITSDLDDYEKFLAQNAARKELDFLSKEI